MNRRAMLRLIASAPMAAGFAWTGAEAAEAHRHLQAAKAAAKAGAPFKPEFFTTQEYQTVQLLTDLILPRDERSGSATAAGVPEFMDFMMRDQPGRQTAMRGGLAWLDLECQEQFNATFVNCSGTQRTAILDRIAWPAKALSGSSQGVAFFTSFRDLTATGFWTSKMGIEDLQYRGNTFVAEWTGCPTEAMERLGVSHPAD